MKRAIRVAIVCCAVICPMALQSSWFSKKPSEKDVSTAVLSGRGDDIKFMMNQHNINPGSVKAEKSSIDGVWKVSYEVKDPVTGKSTKYVSDVTTYERNKGKGVGLHFVNTEEKKDPPARPYYEEHRIINEGTGDVIHAEQATRTVCGFSFGENYLNLGTLSTNLCGATKWWGTTMWRSVCTTKLDKPFRYITHAELHHGEYFGRMMLDTIELYGDAPDSMTSRERQEEVNAMAKILEEKYNIKTHGRWSKRFIQYDSWKEKDYTNFEICAFDKYFHQPEPGLDYRHEFRVRIMNHYPMRMIEEAENPKPKKQKVTKQDFNSKDGADAL